MNKLKHYVWTDTNSVYKGCTPMNRMKYVFKERLHFINGLIKPESLVSILLLLSISYVVLQLAVTLSIITRDLHYENMV